jgi:tetratricopeptide (TPR) repeat protein
MLVWSPALFAAAGEELFEAGRLAVEQNDLERALSAFKAASNAGLSGPAVHFNIGVTAYRLGRYEEADAAFRKAAATPAMAALAHYNLGLVALRRGDHQRAEHWFGRALDEATDERLRALAAEQLGALPSRADRNWVSFLSLGGGYDDNVALVSDADVLGVSGVDDTFTEAQAALAAPLGAPWRVEGGAFLLDYHDLDAFDQLNLYGGGRYQRRVGAWTHEASGSFGYSTLDGERFETTRTVGAQTSLSPALDWRLRVRYRFGDVDAPAPFAGLSGERHEAALELRRRWSAWELAVDYAYDRRDLADAMLAARSHEAGVELGRSIGSDWSMSASALLRASRYDSGDDEQETQLSVRVARRLSAAWRIAAVYSYTDSEADVSGFDYARHRVSAAIEMQL